MWLVSWGSLGGVDGTRGQSIIPSLNELGEVQAGGCNFGAQGRHLETHREAVWVSEILNVWPVSVETLS